MGSGVSCVSLSAGRAYPLSVGSAVCWVLRPAPTSRLRCRLDPAPVCWPPRPRPCLLGPAAPLASPRRFAPPPAVGRVSLFTPPAAVSVALQLQAARGCQRPSCPAQQVTLARGSVGTVRGHHVQCVVGWVCPWSSPELRVLEWSTDRLQVKWPVALFPLAPCGTAFGSGPAP